MSGELRLGGLETTWSRRALHIPGGMLEEMVPFNAFYHNTAKALYKRVTTYIKKLQDISRTTHQEPLTPSQKATAKNFIKSPNELSTNIQLICKDVNRVVCAVNYGNLFDAKGLKIELPTQLDELDVL